MNVFIDTNVLLDFFRMSSGDLDEVRKLAQLSAINKVTLLMSDCVTDEFHRNRESVIAHSLSQFKKSIVELHRPNIVRAHAESVELEQIQSRFKELVGLLARRVQDEASAKKTKADKVIAELFASTTIHNVDTATIEKGMHRVAMRRPPGKKDSCGDAIHWEWLLSQVTNGEDVHIVSRDGDFESEISSGAVVTYLQDEWFSAKNSQCHLYTSLSDFLKSHFAHIKLVDQAKKQQAIEKLEQSPNFATTHNAIASLADIDDYTKEELLRLIKSYQSNRQIHWILGDEDVKALAHKLVTMSYENDLIDEVFPIEVMLNELEIQEMP